MTGKENNIVLFSITLCWASSYVFIKSLPPDMSSFAYLTLTTGIASLVLFVVFFGKIRQFNIPTLKQGFILSLMMAGNLLAEKAGIDQLPSSNASFISSLNILFVPLILLFFHTKPTKNNVAGIVVILFGLALTSGFQISGFLSMGTVYMVIACLFMAAYTIIADRYTKGTDPLLLGISQIWFTALIGFILWTIEEPRTFTTLVYTRQMMSSIFMLAFFAKAYAYIMLMYSQRYTNPVSVTIIASLEPVVTLLLALVIPDSFGRTEIFRIESLSGALLIALGAIVAGTSFLERRGNAVRGKEDRAHDAV